MANVRIDVNHAALEQILRSPRVMAELAARAERIAKAADGNANDPGGHKVHVETGHHRARAAVVTGTPKSMYKEATVRSLTRALDAGR